MFCPRCGKKLEQLTVTNDIPTINWLTASPKEVDEYLDACKVHIDIEREEFLCKKCDMIFYHHHPFQGIESAPGDSWSLSWIK